MEVGEDIISLCSAPRSGAQHGIYGYVQIWRCWKQKERNEKEQMQLDAGCVLYVIHILE